MNDERSLKQRIRRGEIVRGVSVPMVADRNRLESLLSEGSYDFVSVESQHSAFSEDRLVAFCTIAEDLDMPVQFRIKHTRDAYLIGRYLDFGPSGIVVPQVEDESTVDEAVESFYYPQVGKRSWGSAGRGIKDRDDRLAYAEWWNNNGVLCLQLESLEAVINARKLAKPGVDVLFFGPNDLRFSLEAHPEHPFKTVDDCICHVLKQMEGSDVRVGSGTHPPDLRDKYIEMGATVLSGALRP